MEGLEYLPTPDHSPSFIPDVSLYLKTDTSGCKPLHIKKDITPKSEAGLRVSEEEYWKHYYEHPDFRYEWNNGILEVKAVGDFGSFLQADWFYTIIKEHIKTTKKATLVGLVDIGFRLELPKKKSIRKPDLAVILDTNPVQIDFYDRTYKGYFDICIEYLSDADKKGLENDTIVKKIEYSQAGVKEYFILDRKKKDTAFYRLNSKGVYKPIKPRKGIIESKVLPGFRFRVKDLYSQPSLEKLIKDDVYKTFVQKSFQEQIKKTEKERLRAEKEKLRAEKEWLRAEKEKLRAEKAEKAIEIERQKALENERKAIELEAKLQAFLKNDF